MQVIGMSATLPNLHVLAKWLDAQLYSTSYRPIPLLQMVKIGPILYGEDFTVLRDLQSFSEMNVKVNKFDVKIILLILIIVYLEII